MYCPYADTPLQSVWPRNANWFSSRTHADDNCYRKSKHPENTVTYMHYNTENLFDITTVQFATVNITIEPNACNSFQLHIVHAELCLRVENN